MIDIKWGFGRYTCTYDFCNKVAVIHRQVTQGNIVFPIDILALKYSANLNIQIKFIYAQ